MYVRTHAYIQRSRRSTNQSLEEREAFLAIGDNHFLEAGGALIGFEIGFAGLAVWLAAWSAAPYSNLEKRLESRAATSRLAITPSGDLIQSGTTCASGSPHC
ncbi:hypothetical protein FIBSPDRAFT_208098 [Athelia psychrophila]|uniref:Uncharacterized protein n=1 Tax=Athelia psychrophila TaxID=1759441 RepID=A0A166WMC9_9AGAM|nr:hypothetical protein FIBSPDRAFT_208098 [Fibularhizoctonia sp. CBS 109695]